ncbi:MAG: rhomboid family intramembrane serine protease [Verrucomicrobia bacterium]|nr:rhomboid family intramembrane serine protease [Verrucomicrobiota bacterium]
MLARRSPDNEGPLTWIGSVPVHVSTALAGIYCITLVLSALSMGAGAESVLQAFSFSSSAVAHHGSLWQLATYAFVQKPPYIFFLIELYLLVVFGREIEGYLGRASFIKLYLLLLLAPVLVLTAAQWFGWGSFYSGSSALHFGIFMAFVLIFPSAEMFFGIQAKWIALALLAVSSLQCLALSDYTALAVLAVDCVAACLFIGFSQGRLSLKLPVRPVVSRPPVIRPPAAERGGGEDQLESIDPILEKISKSGIASLTKRERDLLERARERLIAKDGRP